MVEIKWTLQALDDLDAICLFIARDAPQVATLFAHRVFKATERIGVFPRSGRIVPETQNESIREIFLGTYSVIYKIRTDEIRILTIHHGSRLLDASTID